MASPDTPNERRLTTYICGSCAKEFVAPDVVAKTKNNVFKSDMDIRAGRYGKKLKREDIEDVIKYGVFKRGLVIVCPHCQTFHT